MKFLSFLRQSFNARSGQTTPPIGYTHKRFHARYLLNDRDLCTIEHVRHGLFRVVDISYQGCLIEPVADANLDHCSVPAIFTLSICGKTMAVEVGECQKRKNGWGLVFQQNEALIRELGCFIEPIRCGSTAISVDVDHTKSARPGYSKKRYQGDGPLDLILEKSSHHEIKFIMITFRRGLEYGSVIWENGQVITKKTVDQEGVGARMAQTQEVDRSLVWACAASCLGMKLADGAHCARILSDWINASHHQDKKIVNR